jgi:hypothetical protein
MNTHRPDILSKIQELLQYMIQRHSKVMVARFDVRFPQNYPEPDRNIHLSNLMKFLKEWYWQNDIEAHYLWVREQNSSDVPHYHVAFLVDGNKCQTATGLLSTAERCWNDVLGIGFYPGLIHHCDLDAGRAWTMLKRPPRGSPEEAIAQFNAACTACFERLSYLAKTHTKGLAPYRVREFGTSQIRWDPPVAWSAPTHLF